MGIFLVYTLGTPPPPSKSDKTLYTDIYLSTFREGTHFIIKRVSFVSGGPYWPKGEHSPLHTPLKSNKKFYTGIYVPTFRVGTC